MAYDAKNNWLYVGTVGGLKVSKDNGGSFQNAITGPGSTNKVFDVKVGSDGSVICALQGGDVRVSTDNGNTFTLVCGTKDTLLPNTAERFSVAIAPSDPNTMYASAAAGNGVFMGVYVSKNKGKSWKRIFNPGGYDDPMSDAYGVYGEYRNVTAVSPYNPDEVFVGSQSLYQVTKIENQDNNYSIVRILYSPIHSIYYSGTTIYLGTSSGILYSPYDGLLGFQSKNRALGNTQLFSMSVNIEGRIMAGTRENGCIYMRNPIDWDTHSESLSNYYSNGGKSAFSIIKPSALYYFDGYSGYRQASFVSDAQAPNQWFTTNGAENCLMKQGVTEPRWRELGNNNDNFYKLALSFTFWESIEDYNSKDTITYIANKDYAPQDSILVKSTRNKYPIRIKNPLSDTLRKDSTLLVQDIVTSRLFMGGGGFTDKGVAVGAPVFMSLTALNYDVAQVWNCVFHTNDENEQVMDMVVSKDGNHLFVLTKSLSGFAIYRVSGFDQYRALKEVDCFNYDYVTKSGYEGSTGTAGLFASNSSRKLEDDTLLILTTGETILSIALDPQDDDNLVFTTNGSSEQVNLIPNATTTTFALPTNKQGNLPNDLPVYTVLIVKQFNDIDVAKTIAYIGTEVGIYKTDNFSASSPTWTLYNNGIDIRVPIFQLYQQTKEVPYGLYVTDGDTTFFPGTSNLGTIYAATHGAGIFVDKSQSVVGIERYSPITKNMDKLKVYPNPTSSSISIDYALQNKASVQLNIVDVMGRVVYTENLGTRESGAYSQMVDCSHLPNGFYFVNMKIGQYTKTAKFVVFK